MPLAHDSAVGDPVAKETESPALVLPGDCGPGRVDGDGSEEERKQQKAGEAKASEAKAFGQEVREKIEERKPLARKAQKKKGCPQYPGGRDPTWDHRDTAQRAAERSEGQGGKDILQTRG